MINHFTKYDENYASGLGTPSLIFVQNGEIVNITVGALAEEDLMSLLKTYSIVE